MTPIATNKAHGLSKEERLRSFGAIRRLFAEGRGGFVYPFRYIVYAEPDEEVSVSVLFSTPKKFHKRANRRNLLRRRMREAYRLNRDLLTSVAAPASIQMALIYNTKEITDYRTIEGAVRKILTKIGETL